MHSNLKGRVAVFLGTIVVAFAGLAAYCQLSPSFGRTEQLDIRRYVTLSGVNAAFGDSQIGTSEKIPGFDFFGPGGLQTVEFNRLVHYLYADTKPQKIIVEMAPQWFGGYHLKREPIITDDALPMFGLTIFSPYFYRSLKDTLLSDLSKLSIISQAVAEEFDAPDPREVFAFSQQWNEEIQSRPGVFDWSKFSSEGRRILTLARAYAQNPVSDFRVNGMADNLEEGIEFLLSRGADVCFFEPPITSDYAHYRPLIDGSNYAEFYTYASELTAKLGVKWVRHVAEFTDDEFNNQDHLHPRGVAKLWPLVAEACFPAP